MRSLFTADLLSSSGIQLQMRAGEGGPSPKDGALSPHVGSSERNAHALPDVKPRREVVSVWGWAGGCVWSSDGDVGTVKL